MALDMLFLHLAHVLANIPPLLGALDALASDFSRPTSAADFLTVSQLLSWKAPTGGSGRAEAIRTTVRSPVVTQRHFRGFWVRKKLRMMASAAILIQRNFRKYMAHYEAPIAEEPAPAPVLLGKGNYGAVFKEGSCAVQSLHYGCTSGQGVISCWSV